MARVLESTGAEVVWIPVMTTNLWYKLYNKAVKEIVRVFPLLCSRLLKRHYLWKCAIAARNMDMGLVESCDVLFAPMLSDSLYYLETEKPIIYLSDATFRLMVDYYWSDLPPRDIKERDMIEQTAIRKAELVYPSHWAMESAVKDYGKSPDKISFACFGPNIALEEITPHVFSNDGHLDLLFVGVDWKRKGGDIAVKACRWLNDNGVEATLHIVGIKSLGQGIASLPYVRDHGFLNKNNPEDYSCLKSLYMSSDCFLLPTLAECAGISFVEASAFGLPCFTHVTGGVPDYVLEGENGRLLPLGSTGDDFGRLIKGCLENGDMERMSRLAVEVARDRLSWDVWASKLVEVIERVSGIASS